MKNKLISPVKKKTLLAIMTLGILISAGYFGGSTVFAQDINVSHDILISRIAERFNLNKIDVEAVLDSVREERTDAAKKSREEKLSKAVSDGIITEAQKSLILSKIDQRIKERRQNQNDLKKWFQDNSIDMQKLKNYLMPNKMGHQMRFSK